MPDSSDGQETPASPRDPGAFYQPVARWPFRLATLFFLICAAAACYLMARDVLAGDFSGPWDAFGDVGTALGSLVLTVVFAWVAFTGRVPERLWKLMWTSIGNEQPRQTSEKSSSTEDGPAPVASNSFDDGGIPHARWPYRIAAGFFVAAALLGTYGQLRAWGRGEWSLGWAHLTDVGMVVMMFAMVWMFGGVARHGRVPYRAWRLFDRASRLR